MNASVVSTTTETNNEIIVIDEPIDIPSMVKGADGTMVNLNTVLSPAEKHNKPRVVRKRKELNKYRHSEKYPFIAYT